MPIQERVKQYDFILGDHGGATDDEITSLLFAYNKKYNYISDSKNYSMEQVNNVASFFSTKIKQYLTLFLAD